MAASDPRSYFEDSYCKPLKPSIAHESDVAAPFVYCPIRRERHVAEPDSPHDLASLEPFAYLRSLAGSWAHGSHSSPFPPSSQSFKPKPLPRLPLEILDDCQQGQVPRFVQHWGQTPERVARKRAISAYLPTDSTL